MTSSSVHPTAIVAEGAQVGEGVEIGPFCTVGTNVVLGDGCKLHSHVVLEGITEIGKQNEFFPFCSVGHQPQDLKFKGEPSKLIIGDGNKVREGVTLQPGTEGGGMETRIGSRNLFMAYSHIGHDSIIGDRNVFANSVAVSGHVTIGSGVILGGLSGVHQFVHLGDLCFLAAGSMVSQDIPPFCMVHGDRAEMVGINTVGLKRAGFESDIIRAVRKAYRQVFFREGGASEAIASARSEFGGIPEVSGFLNFIEGSSRGVARARSKESGESDASESEDA